MKIINTSKLKTKYFLLTAAISIASMALTGCDSDSGAGADSNTQTGQFKDSNVAGLTYTINGESAVTDASGRFNYKAGDTITFSLGGVELGSVTVDEVVTLVRLVSNGSTSDDSVVNRARFLQYLDADLDTANGIQITEEIRSLAADWVVTDFADTTAFESAMGSIEADVTGAINGATLPDAMTAQSHIETTERCVRAGAYQGSYSGDDNGAFGLLVSASTGDVTGYASSASEDGTFPLSATQSVSLDNTGAFISGSASGASFTGSFDSANSLSGDWDSSALGQSGTFSGSRIGGDPNAVYRFTGTFSGSDSGLFAFDVNGSNEVTGVAYSITEDELFDIAGSVDSTTLSATYGSTIGTINGTLDRNSGNLSGSWNNSVDGSSGTFSGDGCKIN